MESDDRPLSPTATYAELQAFRAKPIGWEWLQREIDIFRFDTLVALYAMRSFRVCF